MVYCANFVARAPIALRRRRFSRHVWFGFKIGAFETCQAKARQRASARAAIDHDFFSAGTGTPAIFTLNEPRLVRVQKYTVFQSSPPNATLAVLPKPCTTRPSFLPVGSRM